MNNKHLAFSCVLLLSVVFSPRPAKAQMNLINLVKEVIILNSMVTGERSTERTGRCQIQNNGTVRYQLFQGSYNKERDQIAKLSPQDLSLLLQALKILKQNDQEAHYLRESDFTGDHRNEMGTKFVKNEDGVAFVDSAEIPFYWMKRRLVRTYNGPQASVLREIVRKYCFMSL